MARLGGGQARYPLPSTRYPVPPPGTRYLHHYPGTHHPGYHHRHVHCSEPGPANKHGRPVQNDSFPGRRAKSGCPGDWPCAHSGIRRHAWVSGPVLSQAGLLVSQAGPLPASRCQLGQARASARQGLAVNLVK